MQVRDSADTAIPMTLWSSTRSTPIGHDWKEADDMANNMATTVAHLLHPIPDAQAQLGIGRSMLYELIASGAIQTVKIGSRTLISHDELVRYARSLTKANDAA
jgi:excisionase family DNA binding protein